MTLAQDQSEGGNRTLGSEVTASSHHDFPVREDGRKGVRSARELQSASDREQGGCFAVAHGHSGMATPSCYPAANAEGGNGETDREGERQEEERVEDRASRVSKLRRLFRSTERQLVSLTCQGGRIREGGCEICIPCSLIFASWW